MRGLTAAAVTTTELSTTRPASGPPLLKECRDRLRQVKIVTGCKPLGDIGNPPAIIVGR